MLDDTHSRKVAILGDMGELGPQSDSLHASVGEHLKNLHVDILVTIGTLSAALHEAAKKSAPQTQMPALCRCGQFLKRNRSDLKIRRCRSRKSVPFHGIYKDRGSTAVSKKVAIL